MKKIGFAVMVLLMCIAAENYAKAADCVQVDDTLQMEIPCASYEGSNYSFALEYYPNPDDPAGAYSESGSEILTIHIPFAPVPQRSEKKNLDIQR